MAFDSNQMLAILNLGERLTAAGYTASMIDAIEVASIGNSSTATVKPSETQIRMKKVRGITVEVSPVTAKCLNALSGRTLVSVSQIARIAVEDYISQKMPPPRQGLFTSKLHDEAAQVHCDSTESSHSGRKRINLYAEADLLNLIRANLASYGMRSRLVRNAICWKLSLAENEEILEKVL